MPLSAIIRRKHTVFGLSVRASVRACVIIIESLLARYLTNRLWEFHKTYNFGADGDQKLND